MYTPPQPAVRKITWMSGRALMYLSADRLNSRQGSMGTFDKRVSPKVGGHFSLVRTTSCHPCRDAYSLSISEIASAWLSPRRAIAGTLALAGGTQSALILRYDPDDMQGWCLSRAALDSMA